MHRIVSRRTFLGSSAAIVGSLAAHSLPANATGMTLSDEPGIYIKGEFGIRLEDELLATKDGAEPLTPQSPSLKDPVGDMVQGITAPAFVRVG